MIELPFIMKFDLNFSKDIPTNTVTDKIYELLKNITPKPVLTIYLTKSDKTGNNFISELSEEFETNIILINPVQNESLYDLLNKYTVNIEITKREYDFSTLENHTYNLILPIDITENLYDFIKERNNSNIKHITIRHNFCEYPLCNISEQISLIKKNSELNKKCYLLPYLEDEELKIFYNKSGQLRTFLMCSSLWLNPTINHKGEIEMKCFCSDKSVCDINFFELWDCKNINDLRNKLKEQKQFLICKHCNNFYKDNFFMVEDGILEYKNSRYIFNDILNPVSSSPITGIISENDICMPIPLYSDEDINNAHNNHDLKMIIKSIYK